MEGIVMDLIIGILAGFMIGFISGVICPKQIRIHRRNRYFNG